MIKINRLLDKYYFNEDYISSQIDNMHGFLIGKTVKLDKPQLISLLEKVSLYSKISGDLSSQKPDVQKTNLSILVKKILKKDFVLFETDSLELTCPFLDVSESFDISLAGINNLLVSKMRPKKKYEIHIKFNSNYKILDILNENSEIITEFLFEEIYVKYNKKLIRKRTRQESLFKLKDLRREDVLNFLLVSYPNSIIEKEVNSFLTNYSLDHLLEIYKKLED